VKDRMRALIVLVAVFVFGCFLGATGSYFWFAKYSQFPNAMRETGPPPPHGRPRLPELLEMTHAQEVQFGEIMKESRRQLDALQMDQRPKIEAVLEASNQKISSILDEKQLIKYQAFLKELKKWRSREPRGGGRYGQPPDPSRRMPMMPKDRQRSEMRDEMPMGSWPDPETPRHGRDYAR
jgi:hypothetical protein